MYFKYYTFLVIQLPRIKISLWKWKQLVMKNDSTSPLFQHQECVISSHLLTRHPPQFHRHLHRSQRRNFHGTPNQISSISPRQLHLLHLSSQSKLRRPSRRLHGGNSDRTQLDPFPPRSTRLAQNANSVNSVSFNRR